jgi:hypothetical protein
MRPSFYTRNSQLCLRNSKMIIRPETTNNLSFLVFVEGVEAKTLRFSNETRNRHEGGAFVLTQCVKHTLNSWPLLLI